MPLFNITNGKLEVHRPNEFDTERELQRLIEASLKTVFNCRFIASEFSTGSVHGGRIDTLALSEDGNPVIIEYKKVASSELVNQSLFYLSWIKDHRGDFELAAMRALGGDLEVDWSDVRVICIAPGYKKYDLHAVKMMGANIELWRYRRFDGDLLYLEETYRRSAVAPAADSIDTGKDPVAVAAGKKAAITRATATYEMEDHLKKVPPEFEGIVENLRSYILELTDDVQEVPKKFYVAYKSTQNFVCMEIRKNAILLFLKINPDELEAMPSNARDVRQVGHSGTGDLEVKIRNITEAEDAKALIEMSLEAIGG